MTNLPLEPLSKGQGLAPQLQVEPDTKVMQSHFGRQACLKAVQRMGTLTGEPKGVEQLAIDRFNDLTQSSQPASPVFGPAHLAFLIRNSKGSPGDELHQVEGEFLVPVGAIGAMLAK